jgi:hypothetical protein
MEVFEDANLSSKQISSSGPACGTLWTLPWFTWLIKSRQFN